MPIETDDDRAEILDGHEVVSWVPAGAMPMTVEGIFEREYLGVDTIGHADIETRTPTFLCRTSDVVGVAAGDNIEFDSISFTVVSPQPDGAGMTLLVLRQ